MLKILIFFFVGVTVLILVSYLIKYWITSYRVWKREDAEYLEYKESKKLQEFKESVDTFNSMYHKDDNTTKIKN